MCVHVEVNSCVFWGYVGLIAVESKVQLSKTLVEAYFPIIHLCQAGKWVLSSCKPDMTTIYYFCSECSYNIEHIRRWQLVSWPAHGHVHVFTYFAMHCIYEFLLRPGVSLIRSRRFRKGASLNAQTFIMTRENSGVALRWWMVTSLSLGVLKGKTHLYIQEKC